jgi:uncharacterized protein (DUF1499 family)
MTGALPGPFGVGVILLAAALLAAEAPEARAERGMSTNIIKGLYRNYVRTTADASNPGLRTRTYAGAPGRIFERAKRLAADQSGWKIVGADRDRGIIRVEARTRLFKFIDDVTITVRAATGAGSLVDMESRSRIGLGDFGTNARRVIGFLRKLDDRIRASGEM